MFAFPIPVLYVWAALVSLVLGAVIFALVKTNERIRQAIFVHDYNSFNRTEESLTFRLRVARLVLERAPESAEKRSLVYCIESADERLGNRNSLEGPRPLMWEFNRLEEAMYACVLPEKDETDGHV